MPAKPVCSDEEFVHLFSTVGPLEMTRRLSLQLRGIFARRNRLQLKLRRPILPPKEHHATIPISEHPGVIPIEIKNGTVLVAGDAHIWPGKPTTAMRALVKICKELKPAVIAMNGDVMDFPSISRHPPIGWTKLPTPKEEIEAAHDQMHALAEAAGRARKIWPLGNHDARFETKIATVAPELAEVAGTKLSDHFPLWESCWRLDINSDVTIKHKPNKGGVHSAHNSTLWAGRTTVNNHLHAQKITPITDYNGTRWGVDTGCLADPLAQAFVDYTEAAPLNWRSGFAVLTFKDGKLLPPELVTVWGKDAVTFRGEVIKV